MGFLRYLISSLIAFVLVITGLVAGLKFFEQFEPKDSIGSHRIDVLSELEWINIAELLGEDPRRRKLPKLEDIEERPAFEFPQREVSGFVQLEVSVDTEGRVVDAEVVAAAPRGYYEDEALQEVVTRRYEPILDDGAPVPYTMTEVVEFKVTTQSEETIPE